MIKELEDIIASLKADLEQPYMDSSYYSKIRERIEYLEELKYNLV